MSQTRSQCDPIPADKFESANTNRAAVSFAEIEPKPIDYLWGSQAPNVAQRRNEGGRIPLGMLTILEGDPGLGKSWLTLSIAAALSKGRQPYTGEPCEPAKTLLLSAEDDPSRTIRPRLDTAHADLRRVVTLPEGTDFQLDSSGFTRLREIIDSFGVKLVVIDPITAYTAKDLNKREFARALAKQLDELARELHIAILALRHWNKHSDVENALYRGSGSIDMTAAARSVLAVAARDDDHEADLAHIKSNVGPKLDTLTFSVGEGRFGWIGASDRSARAITAAPGTEKRTQLEKAVDWLREQLTDGPVYSRKVYEHADQAGIARRTLHRAKKRLGVEVNREGQTGPWVWALPIDCQESSGESFGNVGKVGNLDQAAQVAHAATLPRTGGGGTLAEDGGEGRAKVVALRPAAGLPDDDPLPSEPDPWWDASIPADWFERPLDELPRTEARNA